MKVVKQYVKEAKKNSWQKFGEKMEKDSKEKPEAFL